jgi:SNF2 family DNA or RNA helicase
MANLNQSHLHNYQNVAVKHIKENNFCGLFLDMGLGKTVSTLTAIKSLIFEEFDVSKVLIVGPKRVAENVWSDEILKWGHLKSLNMGIIKGNPQERKLVLSKSYDVYTISRDNLAWLCGEYGGSKLPFDMLVIDESSSFKSSKSQRFKALKMVQPFFKRIVLLTGTPSPNGLIDLWAQIYLLDRGTRLGKTLDNYRSRFFTPGSRNGAIIYDYKINEENIKLIHEGIGDICMSMTAKDYLETPGRIDNYIDIKFPKELMDQYLKFEREQVMEIIEAEESKEISALNAAGLSNKLLQFANGSVYDDDKNPQPIHDLKLDALEEIMENNDGKPVLVAYTYVQDLNRILKRFEKYKPVKLKDGADIKNWNAGKIRLLIMHPASGGHGLNLQSGGNIIVWFGQTWSLELYQQFNARLDRQGQKDIVIVHHLVSTGTMDSDVVKALHKKEGSQSALMEAVKYRIDKYNFGNKI